MTQKQYNKLRIVRAAMIIAALACIAFGIWRGEVTEIFRKATRICLECIGVG